MATWKQAKVVRGIAPRYRQFHYQHVGAIEQETIACSHAPLLHGASRMKRVHYILVAVAALAAGTASLVPLTAGTKQQVAAVERVSLLAARSIPEVPGKRFVSLVVEYPPGSGSVPHYHPGSALIYVYVLKGEVRSQIEPEQARIYRTGEWWFEHRASRHRLSANASKTRTAKLLEIFIVDTEANELTVPEPVAEGE